MRMGKIDVDGKGLIWDEDNVWLRRLVKVG